MSIQIISLIIGSIVVPYVIYIHKRLHDMQQKLNAKAERKELEHVYNVLAAPDRVLTQELKDDIKRVEDKLDMIYKMMLTSK